MHTLLADAKKRKYAISAPNVFNRETIEAALLAGKELRSPVILDVAGVHGIYECANIARYYEKRYPEVPAALNLDHGGDYETIISAIHAGFTSVMVDRSTCSYEQNVKEVQEIVKIAHAVGISVEAELGHVGQGHEYAETRDSGLTRPEEAVAYVKENGVDCLAVAVGTSHGAYKGTPKIDFELLSTLSKEIVVPLVLHGGSGTGDDNLSKAIQHGIQKINLNTDLNESGIAYIQTAYDNNLQTKIPGKVNNEFTTKRMNLQQLIMEGVKGWQAKLMFYMKLFGSTNKW
jgi:ketose-bisphosphate aldolases